LLEKFIEGSDLIKQLLFGKNSEEEIKKFMDQGNNNNTISPFENAGLSRVGLEIDILNDQVLSSPNSDENTKILFS